MLLVAVIAVAVAVEDCGCCCCCCCRGLCLWLLLLLLLLLSRIVTCELIFYSRSGRSNMFGQHYPPYSKTYECGAMITVDDTIHSLINEWVWRKAKRDRQIFDLLKIVLTVRQLSDYDTEKTPTFHQAYISTIVLMFYEENLYWLPHVWHMTKIVEGSSADRVCLSKCDVLREYKPFLAHFLQSKVPSRTSSWTSKVSSVPPTFHNSGSHDLESWATKSVQSDMSFVKVFTSVESGLLKFSKIEQSFVLYSLWNGAKSHPGVPFNIIFFSTNAYRSVSIRSACWGKSRENFDWANSLMTKWQLDRGERKYSEGQELWTTWKIGWRASRNWVEEGTCRACMTAV